MGTLKKKVAKGSAFVFLVTGTLAILLQYYLNPGEQRWFFLLIPVISFLVNMLATISFSSKAITGNFSTLLTSLFGIKFISYLIMAVVYFLLDNEKDQRLIFIAYIFVVYLLNTVALLKAVLNFQKTIS
jgi:hypothetical protein